MKHAWLTALVLAATLPVLLSGQGRTGGSGPVGPQGAREQPPASGAGTGGQEAQAQPAPTFRAGVDIVRLDVRVVDDNGLPVRDLRADEVHVFEGGVERPVVLFQHVAEPVGTYLEVARRTIGAEVSTNQGAPRGHLYVFVFDQNHIAPGNEHRARQAVERFIRTRVKGGDRVALYALPGPGPQIPFTSNPAFVLAELPKVRGGLDRQSFGAVSMTPYEAYQVGRNNDAMLQRLLVRASQSGSATLDVTSVDPSRVSGSPVDSSDAAVQVVKSAASTVVSQADAEARAFLMELSDVIRELAAIEGRKSVILVSEGFFGDNVANDVERVAAAAAEAYAVVYSLDINQRGVNVAAADPSGTDPFQEIQDRLEPLGTLAIETSGELVLDASGRGESVLNRIANASQDYYIVGFEPPAAAASDRQRYHRVNVKLARRGARVETRSGYALGTAVSRADRRRAIDSALTAPFPQQGLPVEMTTYVLRGASPGAQRVILSLQAELPVATEGHAAPADIVFMARNARDGRIVTSGSDVMPLPRAPVSGRTTALGQFHVQFDLPSGEYLMRAAVREPGGATGTVDRRFDVPAFDGVDVTASDLIVGRRTDALPVRARGYVEEGISGAMEVYARNPVDLERIDVTVDLVPVNGNTATTSLKADLQEIRRVGTGAGRTALVAIPLTGVLPGDYVVRATLKARGETVTQLVRQVEVVNGAPAAAPVSAPEQVTPRMILAGDLARRFVASIAGKATDPSLQAAVGQARVSAWDKVLPLLGQAPGTHPAAFHQLKGLALFAVGRYGESAEALEAAMAADPTSAPTAFVLGWVHASAGRNAQALTAWRNAIRLDPSMTSAYLALADVYVRLSHPELAVQVLQDGLRVMPSSVELRARMAEIGRR